MRKIGSIPDESAAATFSDYLRAEGIDCRLDEAEEGWQVWVYDEDRVSDARALLDQYRSHPDDPRFADRAAEEQWRRQAELERLLAARRAELPRPRAVVPPLRSTPATLVVIVLCGMVAAVTDFGSDRDLRGWLMLSQWRTTSGLLQTPLLEIRAGEFWRLLTPCFLHFHLLHLVGNVGWLYVLGRQMESALGAWRYVGLLVLLGAVSNLAQGLLSGPNFGGMSGVVCGVFGYVWFKSRYALQEGYTLPTESAVLFLGWVVLCLTGVVGPIANVAHLSGLVLGVLLALPRVSAAVE